MFEGTRVIPAAPPFNICWVWLFVCKCGRGSEMSSNCMTAIVFFLMEPSTSFLSCSRGFSAPANLSYPSAWSAMLSFQYPPAFRWFIFDTRRTISVLLAGHLLYFKSLTREQRRPVTPCGRGSQEMSMTTWQHLPHVPKQGRPREGSWSQPRV